MEIVFVDLEWPREVKHNEDTGLSELTLPKKCQQLRAKSCLDFFTLIIMQEVWQFVSPKKRLISVLLFNFPSKINWKWFEFVVRGQKLCFSLFRACSSLVLIKFL